MDFLQNIQLPEPQLLLRMSLWVKATWNRLISCGIKFFKLYEKTVQQNFQDCPLMMLWKNCWPPERGTDMGCVFSKNTDAELHNVTFDCESPNCQRSIYSEAKKLMQSEKVYFNRVGNGKKIPTVLSAQFAENLVRSRQSDMCILEHGEQMVDLSVRYTSQAIAAWNQIRNILKSGESKWTQLQNFSSLISTS